MPDMAISNTLCCAVADAARGKPVSGGGAGGGGGGAPPCKAAGGGGGGRLPKRPPARGNSTSLAGTRHTSQGDEIC